MPDTAEQDPASEVTESGWETAIRSLGWQTNECLSLLHEMRERGLVPDDLRDEVDETHAETLRVLRESLGMLPA